jgi:hypothetical protein
MQGGWSSVGHTPHLIAGLVAKATFHRGLVSPPRAPSEPVATRSVAPRRLLPGRMTPGRNTRGRNTRGRDARGRDARGPNSTGLNWTCHAWTGRKKRLYPLIGPRQSGSYDIHSTAHSRGLRQWRVGPIRIKRTTERTDHARLADKRRTLIAGDQPPGTARPRRRGCASLPRQECQLRPSLMPGSS